MLGQMASRLWSESPEQIFRLVKIRAARALPALYDPLDAIRVQPKHLSPVVLTDRWERYNRVLRAHGNMSFGPEHILDRTTLELGAGPILGWGPLLLFLGSKRHAFVEPGLRAKPLELVENRKLRSDYFIPLYEELCAQYGRTMSFETWTEKLGAVHALDKLTDGEPADFVVSNSVLEHIHPDAIANVLSGLRRITKPGAMGLHAVDFTPHGLGALEDFYRRDRTRFPAGLNGFRLPEIEQLLRSAGFGVNTTPYRLCNADLASAHASWRDAGEGLRVSVALIVVQ